MLTLYWRSNPYCPYCTAAKTWLNTHEIPYKMIDVAEDAEGLAFLKERGHRSIPQIYAGDNLAVLNGSDGLRALTEDQIVTLRDEAALITS